MTDDERLAHLERWNRGESDFLSEPVHLTEFERIILEHHAIIMDSLSVIHSRNKMST
jgi:hypothetical protein